MVLGNWRRNFRLSLEKFENRAEFFKPIEGNWKLHTRADSSKQSSSSSSSDTSANSVVSNIALPSSSRPLEEPTALPIHPAEQCQITAEQFSSPPFTQDRRHGWRVVWGLLASTDTLLWT